MARKNNKKNHRRATYYHINKFDYEAREKLAEGQLLPKETYSDEKAKVVELRPDYIWNEFWTPTITIQTTSRKAQADVSEHFKGLEARTDLKDKMQ